MTRTMWIGLLIVAIVPGALAQRTKDLALPAPATFAQMNEAFGLAIWADESLWDDRVAAVAERLRWPRESKTAVDESYRLYPHESAQVAGVRPYSLALYGERELVARFSMVFANKGDFPGLGSGNEQRPSRAQREAAKMLESQLRSDGAAIRGRLTALLGEPARARAGASKSVQEETERWDWAGHAIVLVTQEAEYVGLRIVSLAEANAAGKARKEMSDKDFRDLLETRVQKRENGDVILVDIPMVNQGPKGYCVPATWERCLRYMGIPADMYVLAMAGNTGLGGGTSSGAMANAMQRYVSRHGRSVREVGSSVSVRSVAKYIDQGVPVMWSMHVYMPLNEELTRRMATRRQLSTAEEMKGWARQLKERRKVLDGYDRGQAFGHMCMIIGYNAATKELCISDSWGEAFAERWLSEDEAETINGRRLDVVRW